MTSKKPDNTPTVYMKTDLPFTFHNMGAHFERTFELWTIKNPSIEIQLKRTLVFITSLIITIYWPIQDLLLEALLLCLFWILLSLTSRKIPYLLLMTNMMLNIAFFFYITQVWLPHLIQK